MQKAASSRDTELCIEWRIANINVYFEKSIYFFIDPLYIIHYHMDRMECIYISMGSHQTKRSETKSYISISTKNISLMSSITNIYCVKKD